MLFCVNKNQGTGLTVFRQTFVLDDWHSNIRIWLGLIKKWVCFHCMEKLHRFTISPDKWETLVEKLTISIKRVLKWAGKSWWFSARRGNNFETKLDPIFSIFLKIYSLGFSLVFFLLLPYAVLTCQYIMEQGCQILPLELLFFVVFSMKKNNIRTAPSILQIYRYK